MVYKAIVKPQVVDAKHTTKRLFELLRCGGYDDRWSLLTD
jgi:hypothetical protein